MKTSGRWLENDNRSKEIGGKPNRKLKSNRKREKIQ